jgi:protein TonB
MKSKNHMARRCFICLALGWLLVVAQPAAADEAALQSTDYQGYMETKGCKPTWPKASLTNREFGNVTVGFFVSADGTVADSKILRSSGFRDLDHATLIGILRCKFPAAIENGKPVGSWVKMQYRGRSSRQI